MSVKTTEGRFQAFARCTSGDIDPFDAEDERKLVRAQCRRRRRLARRQRKELLLSRHILHIEPVLRERAVGELMLLRDPEIFEARVEVLEKSSEIGSHFVAAFLTENDILVQQHFAAA